jgi:putative flippase GtrA
MKRAILVDGMAQPSRPAAKRMKSVSFTRVARFVFVGVVSAGVQLGLLEAFTDILGWPTLVANIIAFIIATNINLALNSAITWRDQPLGGLRGVLRRWLRFWGSISGTAVVNQAIFFVALRWMPDLVAAALASTVVSIVNFILGHFFVFTTPAA